MVKHFCDLCDKRLISTECASANFTYYDKGARIEKKYEICPTCMSRFVGAIQRVEQITLEEYHRRNLGISWDGNV